MLQVCCFLIPYHKGASKITIQILSMLKTCLLRNKINTLLLFSWSVGQPVKLIHQKIIIYVTPKMIKVQFLAGIEPLMKGILHTFL